MIDSLTTLFDLYFLLDQTPSKSVTTFDLLNIMPDQHPTNGSAKWFD